MSYAKLTLSALSALLLQATTSLADLPPILQCFEVHPPVRGPSGPLSSTVGFLPSDACSVQLMSHAFGSSYGKPFVSAYVPPAQCGDFNRVIVNLTVSSVGRQYDRLATVFLGDVEVWRTSTAEPSPDTPIQWTHLVDMTPYLALWKLPQKLIFDLGNLVNDRYTGVFHAELTATFFTDHDNDGEAFDPAHVIVPITSRRSAEGQPSVWHYPALDKPSVIIKEIPANAKRAVVALSANGQLAEEFWWANQLESDKAAFPPDTVSGMSPFREVQLLIDGELAGLQWPHPVVFTGGYAPNMHRPVVGIGAFALRESEVDVTAWLPFLADGKSHSIELAVVGIDDDGKGGAKLAEVTEQYWVLSAKMFIWTGEEPVKIGGKPRVSVADPDISYRSRLMRNSTNHPEKLLYNVTVSRELSISGITHDGSTEWSQKVSFHATGDMRAYAGYQTTSLYIKGEDRASGQVPYLARYSYPTSLLSNQTIYKTSTGDDALRIYVELNQTRSLQVHGRSALANDAEAFVTPDEKRYPGFRSTTTKNGTGEFLLGAGQDGVMRRAATANQTFGLWGEMSEGGGGAEELYTRTVRAAKDRVEWDLEAVRGIELSHGDVEDVAGVTAEERNYVLGTETDFAPARGLVGKASQRGREPSAHAENLADEQLPRRLDL